MDNHMYKYHEVYVENYCSISSNIKKEIHINSNMTNRVTDYNIKINHKYKKNEL